MKFNLPNKLTIFRIICVPVYMFFIMVPVISDTWSRVFACAVFVLAAITDFLDGHLARKMDQVTDFGKFMDPIADKFMIIGAYIAFAASEQYRYIYWITMISLAVIIFRELAVTSLRLIAAGSENHTVIAANWLGKIKTVLQIFSVIMIIIEPIIIPEDSPIFRLSLFSVIFMALMIGATVASGINYFNKYKNVIFKAD